jgi:glyoxylase-like metal-dependent hydrolase (beta-lactamase superfamily II)
MNIKHFYDDALAQGSFAIESEGKVALVDPSRDIKPYLDFAKQYNAEIVAVFETHPHADFISSHLELQEKFGADIYVNEKVGVDYDFKHIGHGDEVKIGNATFRALFTPGHSPDHNSYLLLDENGIQKAVFTGDSLFVGDVGRPDLREGAGNIQVSRKELAGMMYDTVNDVFADLSDETIVCIHPTKPSLSD